MSIAEKLTTVAENEQKVYEAGKKAEYDAFWDTYQDNGNRTSYDYAFYGKRWNDVTFNPKYNIIIRGTDGVSTFFASQITDLVTILERNNINFDMSGCSNATNLFARSMVTRLPVLNITSLTTAAGFLNGCKDLVSIEKIILKSDGSQAFSNVLFQNNTSLENLTIEGMIGQNGFDTHWSALLSKESITSIINALSAATSDLTVTLSQTAVNNAFETSEGAADGSTSDEWAELIATKPNWTVALG